MIVAGIDFGRKRIGLAIRERSLVYPLETLERRTLEQDLRTIRSCLEDRGVSLVVVGLPLRMGGKEGAMASAARAFAERVAEVTGLPVEMADERLSSFEANDRLRGLKVKRASKKSARNALAAAVILENWLATRRTAGGR